MKSYFTEVTNALCSFDLFGEFCAHSKWRNPPFLSISRWSRSDMLMVRFRKTRCSEGWVLLSSIQLPPVEKKQVCGRVGSTGQNKNGAISEEVQLAGSPFFKVFFCPKAVLRPETWVKLRSELTDAVLDLKQAVKSQKPSHRRDDRKSALGKNVVHLIRERKYRHKKPPESYDRVKPYHSRGLYQKKVPIFFC